MSPCLLLGLFRRYFLVRRYFEFTQYKSTICAEEALGVSNTTRGALVDG